MPQTRAEPHPVAGGQIRSAAVPDASGQLVEQVLDYEVWVDPEHEDAWVDVSPVPAVFPLRLYAVDVTLLHSRVAEHSVADADAIRSVGVGVSDGTVLVALRQEWPLVSMVLLGLLLATTIGLAALLVRGRRRTVRALVLAANQATSREDERTRIAREIHDGPLQDLALIARTVPHAEQARVREVTAELRALATDLRPPALDRLGLVAALADLADRWATAPIPLSVRVQTDAPGRLPPDLELALYRVCQEALANAVAHGEARTAWVFLRAEPHVPRLGNKIPSDAPSSLPASGVDLVVRDDGKGLPQRTASERRALVANGHFGLAGMAERARAFGGTLALTRGPGGLGTEVRLHVPHSSATRRRWRRRPLAPHSRPDSLRP